MITLKNKNGMTLTLDPVGATITDLTAKGLHIADRGITIGRFANRISNGTFTLDGKEYHIPINDGKNVLHGGPEGFATKTWTVNEQTDHSAVLSVHSPDGDMGFPGNLDLTVSIDLTDENELIFRYKAVCDQPTVVNFTNHAFFNLNGGGPADHHRVWIDAEFYCEMGDGLIPTGKLLPVAGTRYDFNKPKLLEGFYDDCFSLYSGGMRHVATLMGNDAQIAMDVVTDQPAMQLFNTKDRVCLETQHFPDSPNRPEFPDVVLRPGDVFQSTTMYKFSF